MKATVKSDAGYYARINGRPTWVQDKADAKVFGTTRVAQGLVKILWENGIRAAVERVKRKQ